MLSNKHHKIPVENWIISARDVIVDFNFFLSHSAKNEETLKKYELYLDSNFFQDATFTASRPN